jgi:hypothetical protein
MTGSDRRRVRVRKARRSGIVGCGHWVAQGAQIVSKSRGPWRCMTCALTTVRAARTVPEVLADERRHP